MSVATSLANLREAIFERIGQLTYSLAEKEEALAEKEEALAEINEIKRYLTYGPWKANFNPTTYVDPLGEIQIGYKNSEYGPAEFDIGKYLVACDWVDCYTNFGPITINWSMANGGASGWGIDLSHAKHVAFISFRDYGAIPDTVKRFICSTDFSYNSCTLHSTGNMTDGLYLSKLSTKQKYVQSSWVGYAKTGVEIPVKNPPDSNVPYYLNKMGISADDMVGIFENMIDRSAETEVKYITLGSTNLAKLTEEQKEIAYRKGWDLQ